MKILKEEIIRLGTVFGVGMARISNAQIKQFLYDAGDMSDLDVSHKDFNQIIERITIKNVWFNRGNLTKVNFSRFPIHSCEFRTAELEGAIIRSTEIHSCDFREAKMMESVLTGSRFNRCDFSGADLRHCSFRGSTITNCDFRGAKLQGADFRNCTMEVAVFDRHWRIKNGMMVKANPSIDKV